MGLAYKYFYTETVLWKNAKATLNTLYKLEFEQSNIKYSIEVYESCASTLNYSMVCTLEALLLEALLLEENPNFKVFRCSWSVIVSAVAVLDSEETGTDPDSCCSWSRCCFWASALIDIKELGRRQSIL